MNPLHPTLASGRWHTFSLAEQLGNIGSDISRALHAKEAGDSTHMQPALDRALELFDLTMTDPKHRGRRLREICRMREAVCDYFFGENTYGSTPATLDHYFLTLALLARKARA